MSPPPEQRRRPRMSVILPQPHMIFHFTKPRNSENLVDDDVIDATSEESDACSKPKPDQTPKKEDNDSQFKLEVVNSSNDRSFGARKRKSYFDCNLCLEAERQPVVTACGHFFCHSCLCEWLEISRKCPVCEAELLEGGVCFRFINAPGSLEG